MSVFYLEKMIILIMHDAMYTMLHMNFGFSTISIKYLVTHWNFDGFLLSNWMRSIHWVKLNAFKTIMIVYNLALKVKNYQSTYLKS